MDVMSIVGIVLSLLAIIGGNLMGGGDMGALINSHAFVIVVGGTLGATLLQFPPRVIWRSLSILIWIIKPPKHTIQNQIDQILEWSLLARREGLLGLEALIELQADSLVQKGLQLVVDGNDPEVIRDCMGVEVSTREYFDTQAAKVYEAMGGYAPTIGILGAVIGLIHVMQHLAKPEMLGSGIATAFVATIYGVALANLLCIPIAHKLKSCIFQTTVAHELLIEGIAAIAEGENPRNIELKLSGYL